MLLHRLYVVCELWEISLLVNQHQNSFLKRKLYPNCHQEKLNMNNSMRVNMIENYMGESSGNA